MRVDVAVLLLILAAPVATDAHTQEPECPASSLVNASAPRDQGADPIVSADWYINADRSIWAGPVPGGGWYARGVVWQATRQVKGQKTYWVRPAGEQLVVTGRRLDAASPPLEANIPCCFTSGFQIVALHFPTAGCWEVSAKAGDHQLRFVTRVRARE